LTKKKADCSAGRQGNDHDLETWAAEIKLRANRRIGELSAGLEKTQGARSDKQLLPLNGRSLKLATLAAAGIRQQQASRCERLASVPAETTQVVVCEMVCKIGCR